MHIVHVITTLKRGGAELHLLSLVKGQCQRPGMHVSVVSLAQEDGALGPAFAAVGAQVIPVPMRSKWFPFSVIFRLARLFKALHADIIHSHLLPANVVAGWAAKLVGAVHVASKHNDERQIADSRLWRWLHAFSSRRCDTAVICLSRYVGDYMARHGLDPAKIRVVHYGFEKAVHGVDANSDIHEEFRLPADAFVCGIIARITPQKGHTYLLQAFARFAARVPQARLFIVGEPDYNTSSPDEVELLLDRLHLRDKVFVLGRREDAYSLLAQMHVMCLPSLWEGFGMVLLEAASLGVPVIASRVSSIPEVLGEESWLLVPPQSIDALETALFEVYEHYPAWKAQAVRSGAERIALFTMEKLVRGTEDVYRQVLPGDKA